MDNNGGPVTVVLTVDVPALSTTNADRGGMARAGLLLVPSASRAPETFPEFTGMLRARRLRRSPLLPDGWDIVAAINAEAISEQRSFSFAGARRWAPFSAPSIQADSAN